MLKIPRIIGINMDGSKFATLILHIPNIFSPIAIISILPTQVIYVITVSFKILDKLSLHGYNGQD